MRGDSSALEKKQELCEQWPIVIRLNYHEIATDVTVKLGTTTQVIGCLSPVNRCSKVIDIGISPV